MIVLYAILFCLCLGTSFLMSGMEAGVLALSRLRIRQLLRHGNKRARVLNEFLEQPENFLWTILVGNTLANFVAVCLVMRVLFAWLPKNPPLVAVLLVVLFFVFYSLYDLLPKMLFRRFPNRLCLFLAGPFRLAHLLLSPLVWALERFSDWVTLWTGGRVFTGQMFANRDEFRLVMQESAQGLTPEERNMIQRLLELQNLTVRQIMKPIEQAVCVTRQTPMTDALSLCRTQKLTRLPVMELTGRTRRVAGVLSLKSVLYREDLDESKTVGEYLQPSVLLDPEMRLEVALQRIQRSGQRLGIVVARDQRPLGIVTAQDILRIMFGEVNL